ncbi:MAG: hypothetical protein CBD03_05045 [Rhizobiales bacterium TMED143]|nr:MAG: hypothetical protein CBD03_05045 [Rhizobiales bacterium TMED143]|tara:strand:+ start:1373 stop:1552 length:180 start_codon:yes stop_codon:yes gene_type:complete
MTVWIVLAETEQLGNGVQAVFDNPKSAETFREIREKSETIRGVRYLIIPFKVQNGVNHD